MSVYLDYNASAPVRAEVLDAVREAMELAPGNPSSMHAEGRRAARLLDEARDRVARLVGASPKHVVFTSGATESNNLAMRGALAADPSLQIVTSRIEHASILATAADLESSRSVPVVRLGVDERGRIDPIELAAQTARRPSLVSVGWANGETGHVADIEALLGHVDASALVHVDAAQAVGRVPVALRRGIGLLAFSGHKLGGPRGIGALIVADERLRAVTTGGPQERRLRAGTENVAGAVGLGVAAELARQELEEEARRLIALREGLWLQLAAQLGDVMRLTPDDGLPNTLAVAVPDAGAEILIAGLDLAGFCVSSGSACAAGAPERSHVVEALGVAERYWDGVVRISMGSGTVAHELTDLAAAFARVVARVREAA